MEGASPEGESPRLAASPGLRGNRDFLKLWAGLTITQLGALMGALQFTAVLVLDASPPQMAALAATGIAPGIMVGLAGGVWVDRLPRRRLLVLANLGRATALASIPAAYLPGWLRMEQLYLVSLLVGAMNSLSDIAAQSYLPSMVAPEELVEANRRLATGSAVEIGAFSLTGWTVQLFTAASAVALNAATFLASALLLGRVRSVEPHLAGRQEQQHVLEEMGAGLQTLWRHPLLRPLAGSAVPWGIGNGLIGTVIVLYGVKELGIPPGLLGTIFAVGGASSIAGALVAPRLVRWLGIGPAVLGGMAVAGLAILFIPLAHGPLVLASAFLVGQQLLGDGAATISEISQTSIRQAAVPGHLLGRVNATMHLLSLGGMLVGSLLAGLVGEVLGLQATLVVGAGCILLGALWLTFSPLRTLRQLPPPL